MENGLNYMAVAFAMQLVKILLVDERSVAHITEADLFHTIETLMRINAHSRGNAPEGWGWNTWDLWIQHSKKALEMNVQTY